MIHETVTIGACALEGELTVPGKARGLVLFVHGSGSSRKSPRNRRVAQSLQQCRLGTLLFDLLTPAESMRQDKVFDIPLLTHRTLQAIDWWRRRSHLQALPLGLFGASTGAAAALFAAAARPQEVAAVVSRGGRPDLAGKALPRVRAPTLLIVGQADTEVLALNLAAHGQLSCEKRMEVVLGATHLFEEAGALEMVATLAGDWFVHHLVAHTPAPALS